MALVFMDFMWFVYCMQLLCEALNCRSENHRRAQS